MTSANPKKGSHQQLLGGEQAGGPKERWKKERGKSIEKNIIKIHAGLNKLRSPAGRILDLGFETERVPLPLAIWLF